MYDTEPVSYTSRSKVLLKEDGLVLIELRNFLIQYVHPSNGCSWSQGRNFLEKTRRYISGVYNRVMTGTFFFVHDLLTFESKRT